MVVTLLIIVVAVFLMFYVIPGSPARIMLGMDAPQEKVELLEEELGLNDPLPVRFVRYLGGLLKGNPGNSVRFGEPVGDMIAQRLPVTLTLAFLSFAMVLLIALPLGILAAHKPGGPWIRPFTSSVRSIWPSPPFYGDPVEVGCGSGMAGAGQCRLCTARGKRERFLCLP